MLIPAQLKQFMFDGYLCGCGTYLTYHDEVLFTRNIDKKRGREILKKMAGMQFDGLQKERKIFIFQRGLPGLNVWRHPEDIFSPMVLDWNVISKKMISFMTRCSFMQMRKSNLQEFLRLSKRYGSN